MMGSVKEKKGIFWCKKCNTPLFSPHCSLCNGKARYCSSDLRPIFEKERIMLSRKLNSEIPLNTFYNKGRLIYNGETLLHFSAKDEELFVRKYNSQRYAFKPVPIEQSFRNALKANKEYLENLETEAIQFIQETYNKSKGEIEAITIAFSGGKDSMVVADLVKRALPKEELLFFLLILR